MPFGLTSSEQRVGERKPSNRRPEGFNKLHNEHKQLFFCPFFLQPTAEKHLVSRSIFPCEEISSDLIFSSIIKPGKLRFAFSLLFSYLIMAKSEITCIFDFEKNNK